MWPVGQQSPVPWASSPGQKRQAIDQSQENRRGNYRLALAREDGGIRTPSQCCCRRHGDGGGGGILSASSLSQLSSQALPRGHCRTYSQKHSLPLHPRALLQTPSCLTWTPVTCLSLNSMYLCLPAYMTLGARHPALARRAWGTGWLQTRPPIWRVSPQRAGQGPISLCTINSEEKQPPRALCKDHRELSSEGQQATLESRHQA